MDNICYLCHQNPGVECLGRRPDEKTKCKQCLYKYMVSENVNEAIHQLNMINQMVQENRIDEAREFVNVFQKFDEYAWKFYESRLNY
jgi:hypothetical protein